MGDADVDPADFYTGLVARLYAPLRSVDPDPAPYAAFIAAVGQPALELGCGDGDPLLDLAAQGLDVEGLDSSADMLDRARQRAAERDLAVTLHHAPMEAMDLGRRYGSIFLAGPTFNLVLDDDLVATALRRIHDHLEPGGAALIPLFVPEDETDRVGEVTESGSMRVTRLGCERDEEARTQTVVLRYEDGDEAVERPWTLHWHTQDQFRALAEAAGLEVSAVMAPDGREAAPDADQFVFWLTRP
ncbi:MAG TPA: class I SAM-dependent methyltransferase [Iamia sp.]